MRTFRRLTLFFFCVFLASFLAGQELKLSDYQFSKIQEENRGNKKTLTIKEDPSGEIFRLTYQENLTPEQIKNLNSLRNLLKNFKHLKAKQQEFVFSKNSIDLILIPSQFGYDGTDFIPYFPAGLSFFYDPAQKILSYDLKLLKENRVYPVSGTLQEEIPFLENILVYIREKDPEAFFTRQKEQETEQFRDSQIQEEEKKQSEILEKKYRSSGFSHAVKIYAGTGTLASLGYSFGWGGFQIMPYSGLIYYQANGKKKIGVPAGLKSSYAFFRSEFFEPYFFVGGAYNFSVQNYESRFVAYGGIGEILFNYLFTEISYMTSKNSSEFSLGLGFHLPF